MSASVQKYSAAQRGIHWLTLLVLVGSFATNDAMGAVWEAMMRTGAAEVTTGARAHQILGFTILVLTLTRLVLRFAQGVPAPVAGQSAMVTLASSIVHGLLYVVLVALPVSGMMAFGGGIAAAGAAHGVLVVLLLALVGGHAAAALVHQFVFRDNLLARMR